MLVELDPKLPVLPHSITKRIGELFGQLFEPFQRRAGPARAEYIGISVGATRSNYYYLTPPRWPGPVSMKSHHECRSGSKKPLLPDLRSMDWASARTTLNRGKIIRGRNCTNN